VTVKNPFAAKRQVLLARECWKHNSEIESLWGAPRRVLLRQGWDSTEFYVLGRSVTRTAAWPFSKMSRLLS